MPQRTGTHSHHFHAGVEGHQHGADECQRSRHQQRAAAFVATQGPPACHGRETALLVGMLLQQRTEGQPGVQDQAGEVDRDEKGAPGHPGRWREEGIEMPEAARLVQVGQQRHRGAQAAHQRRQQGQARDHFPALLAQGHARQRQQEGAVGQADQEEVLHGPGQPGHFACDVDGFDNRAHGVLLINRGWRAVSTACPGLRPCLRSARPARCSTPAAWCPARA